MRNDFTKLWCARHQRLLPSPSEIKIPVPVCMKLKKKRKCWNKLPGEVGDSLFKNRSRQTSVRKYRRLFDLVSELGERLNAAVKPFSALREHSSTHIFISAQVCVWMYAFPHFQGQALGPCDNLCLWILRVNYTQLCSLLASSNLSFSSILMSFVPRVDQITVSNLLMVFFSCSSEVPSILWDFQQFHLTPKAQLWMHFLR